MVPRKLLQFTVAALALIARPALAAEPIAADATVALDGSAQFTTVQAAIEVAPADRLEPFTIHIAPGKYKEVITVPAEKPFVRFVGDDADKTILTFDNFADMPGPDGKKIGTRNTASTYLKADDFAADHLTFQNTPGLGSQALAVSVTGDRCAFRH
ncbi:MAG TPA: pectinesterase family protein, partial [Lacipirellulaceae bacterium]